MAIRTPILLVSMVLLCANPALAQRSLTIHVQGSQPGKKVLVEVIDLQTRVNVYKVVEVCTPEVFQLPNDLRFLLIIRDWDSMLLLHQSWQRDSGPISVSPTVPTATGHCGDGLITGAEVCDVKGNVGCPSTKPACLDCGDCGCFATIHCPQPSPSIGSCGWGRCSAAERPHFFPVCAWGACLFRYDCQPDPSCVAMACMPDADTQQECSDTCADPAKCWYDTTTSCWTCQDPAVVPNQCASPEEMGCLLDPALVGSTAETSTLDSPEDLLEQFSLDELTEDEGLIVMTAEGHLEPAMWTLRVLDVEQVSWRDGAFDAFNIYRGDVALLATEGYSQLPVANPLAAQFCGLPGPPLVDSLVGLLPGQAAFYLMTATVDTEENGMGFTSIGDPRLNLMPCP